MERIDFNIYGQFIKITSDNYYKLISILTGFFYRLTTHKLVKVKRGKQSIIKTEIDQMFFIEEHQHPELSKSMECIRVPRSLEKELITYITHRLKSLGLNPDIINIIHHESVKGIAIDIEFNPNIILRDYQEEYVKGIINSPTNNVLVDLYTGMGKTVIAMNAISRIGKKFCVMILPTYIDKWIGDITGLTNIKKEEIMVLKGSNSILRLLEMPDKELKNYKAFILSLPTISQFIKSYLTGKLVDYGDYSPEDVFNKMGIEVLLNDEGHQHFHQVVTASLFANVKRFVILTATLISNIRSKERVYRLIIPDGHRLTNIVKYDPYVIITSVAFTFRKPKRITFKGTHGYSQVLYEKSILRDSSVLKNYLKMIKSLVDTYYIAKKKKEDEKCLIFAGTIVMCEKIAEYLKEEYPDLKISKYTEEEPYETVLNNNIIVSTIQSAGTALDIPNLITVIQTINIESFASNEQVRGRLRRLKDNETNFVFIWSLDIPQHRKYTEKRIRLFEDKAKAFYSKKYKEQI